MPNFLERLDTILSERKKTPFIKKLGFSGGVSEHISKGNTPGSEVLIAIQRTENASLNWLVDGKGKPFCVTIRSSDEAMAEELSIHFEDCSYRVNLIHDHSHLVIELSEPAQFEYKGKPIDYVHYEYLTGPIGTKTRDRLIRHYEQFRNGWNETALDTPELDRLRRGEMGPYELHGDDKQKGIAHSWPIDSEEHLLNILPPIVQKSSTSEEGVADFQLMRAVIQMVEDIASDEGIQLTIDQKARVYTSAYRHAVKSGLGPDDLDPHTISSIIEVL